jgi:lipopolysaccharide export system permease protein
MLSLVEFIHANGLTFYAERAEPAAEGLRLAKVFVHQDRADGGSIVITGENGLLAQAEDESPVLILLQGMRVEMPSDAPPESLSFDHLSWPVVSDADTTFRPRGTDQRELTLTELWTLPATATSKPDVAEVAAELHSRLVLIATVPLLPLLAAPLALAGGPRSQRSGIVVGLLILVVYYEALRQVAPFSYIIV